MERNGGADASFDSFSFDTAAAEILLGLIDTYLPQDSTKAKALRARAEALRLPSNPLVGANGKEGARQLYCDQTKWRETLWRVCFVTRALLPRALTPGTASRLHPRKTREKPGG